MRPEEFQARFAVSRETLERFRCYAALLVKWNRAINLVGPKTLNDLWRRHFLDSAQLQAYLPQVPDTGERQILDVGAGAGFPGMVLALLGCGRVHLVESDQRKAIFLREVAREVVSDAHIHAVRLDQMRHFQVDVVTARAFAPLPELLDQAAPFLLDGGCGLFLKGKAVTKELAEARLYWSMRADRFPSRSDPTGTILQIGVLGREVVRH